jgi:hypothetical protein
MAGRAHRLEIFVDADGRIVTTDPDLFELYRDVAPAESADARRGLQSERDPDSESPAVRRTGLARERAGYD